MAGKLFELELIYHHVLSRSLVLKLLLASAAVAALPFLASLQWTDSSDGCDPIIPSSAAAASIPPSDLDAVVRDLIDGGWVWPGLRALCVGPAAAAAAMRRGGVRTTVGQPDRCGGGLGFGERSFDFVVSVGLDRAGAPARVVLEMERVLRPGRAGAVVGRPGRGGGLAMAAAPVAAVIRVSDVVAVRMVNGSEPVAVVVFRKRRE